MSTPVDDLVFARHQALLIALDELGQLMEDGRMDPATALVNATTHQVRATLVLADEIRALRKQLEAMAADMEASE